MTSAEVVALSSSEPQVAPIVAIGGANGETLLHLAAEVQWGGKQSVASRDLMGGSALNYTLRLLATGHEVWPIFAIGQDRIGNAIRERVLAVAQSAGCAERLLEFIASPRFLIEAMRTSNSTIIVHGSRRTIFSESLRGAGFVQAHIQERLTEIGRQIGGPPSAVLIGHIHSDSDRLEDDGAGACTRSALDAVAGSPLVYANFGNSQIRLGHNYWDEALSQIHVFQLNLAESKRFFASGDRLPGLAEILDRLRERGKTAIITLDRFGAVATHRDFPERVILAWPAIEAADIVDTTGAGDAFAAGMLSVLIHRPDLTFEDFFEAIETARLWSAHACTVLGASSHCPGPAELGSFAEGLPRRSARAVEVQTLAAARQIMDLIDLAYQ